MRTASASDVLSDGRAVALLLQLERDGFSVALDGDDLLVGPSERVTPELAAEIRACKRALLMLLRICDEGVQQRRVVFAGEPHPEAAVFRPDVPANRGVCFSCGDRLESARPGRCWRCALAWRLAARVPIPVTWADAYSASCMV